MQRRGPSRRKQVRFPQHKVPYWELRPALACLLVCIFLRTCVPEMGLSSAQKESIRAPSGAELLLPVDA